MNLQNLIAISGRNGLFRMINNRSNGLLVEELATGKRLFVSGRLHEFTPLESISVYVQNKEETTSLAAVFQAMLDHQAQTPPPAASASGNDIKAYFELVLPEYDRNQVMLSDMKKIIKWFSFLAEKSLV